MEEKISQIKKEYLGKINRAENLGQLDEIFLSLFGKNGEISLIPKSFSKLSKKELQIITPLFNQTKAELEESIEKKREEVREEKYAKLSDEKIDLTRMAFPDQVWEPRKSNGHLHPTTQFIHETVEVFKKLGFQQYEAPHIDTEKYNFTLLNIPDNHPAMDLWDTMYLNLPDPEDSNKKMLLRTHTSNAQIRVMREFNPPFRIMSIGRCFRYENLDARHEHTFEQFELIYVDKDLSMANLQYLSEYYIKSTIGKDIKARLRPKYYPFVEPGFGIDTECIFCKGQGCKICGGAGWIEIGGAGMIHPNVLKNGGVDPNIYSGIAWGPGVERMMMMKHGIADVRLFLSGDLKFLEKF